MFKVSDKPAPKQDGLDVSKKEQKPEAKVEKEEP